MHRIYANLLGNWTDITSDGLIDETEPITYLKEQIQDLCKYLLSRKNLSNPSVNDSDCQ